MKSDLTYNKWCVKMEEAWKRIACRTGRMPGAIYMGHEEFTNYIHVLPPDKHPAPIKGRRTYFFLGVEILVVNVNNYFRVI